MTYKGFTQRGAGERRVTYGLLLVSGFGAIVLLWSVGEEFNNSFKGNKAFIALLNKFFKRGQHSITKSSYEKDFIGAC